MHAGERVVALASGTWDGSLNLYSRPGNCLVATQHADEWAHVVRQGPCEAAHYTAAERIGEEDEARPPFIESDDIRMDREPLRPLRWNFLIRRCGICAAWIFRTTCSSAGSGTPPCGYGSVAFRHASHRGGGDDQ